MCGISGYLTWNQNGTINPPQRELIEKMNPQWLDLYLTFNN